MSWLSQSWKTDEMSSTPQALGQEKEPTPECCLLTTACLAIAEAIRRSYFEVADCEVQGWHTDCTRPEGQCGNHKPQ